MRLMPSVSPGLQPRKVLLLANWPRRDLTNCVKWCACANGSSRTVATTCANFTAHSTLVFPSSPAMYKISIVNWRLAYFAHYPTAAAIGKVSVKGWPVCRYDSRIIT